MSTLLDPPIAPKGRLLRPLPTAGAGKRVRAKKETQPAVASENDDKGTSNGDNLPTPKAPAQELPLSSQATTPKVPVILLNDDSLLEPVETKTLFIIDEAKDAELREKFLSINLYEPPKRVVPKLKIPKNVKPPPKPVQRQMARVKPTVTTAPRPEISFGTTVTTFGPPTEDTSKPATDKDPEAIPVNLQALRRRQIREKKERLGVSHRKPHLPLSLDLEGDDDTHKSEEDNSEEDAEDIEERKRKGREKMKEITLMMARDIQQWNIPKSKLKAMAKGKTEEETAARKRVLEMAWKLAKRQQDKEKGKGKWKAPSKSEPSQAVEEPDTDGPKTDNAKEESVPNSVEEKSTKQVEKLRKSKGKERAPNLSATPNDDVDKASK